MNALLIGIIVLAVIVVIALAATNPMMKKREDAAIKVAKDKLGKDKIKVIEPRTTAMGTDPEEAGGLRGMSCLAVTDTDLMAVTWSGLKEWSIPRSSIVSVDSAADDPAAVQKGTITVAFTHDGGKATAMFRLREPVPWLIELGYDWGPDGPPEIESVDGDDEISETSDKDES